MRAIAVPMILLMLSASLAGCTGGDPDGNDESSIDMDILNQMIDDNLQDFINNTSVTVNQEIHYDNDGSVDGNHSGYGGILHGIDFEFTLDSLWGNSEVEPGDRNNNYVTNWTYYDYLTNQQRDDEFTFSCSVYYLVGSANSSNIETYWENNNYYDQAWDDNGYNSTMRDIFNSVAWDSDLRFTCDDEFYGYDQGNNYYSEVVYTITIPEGYAFRCTTPIYYNIFYYSGNSSDGDRNDWVENPSISAMVTIY